MRPLYLNLRLPMKTSPNPLSYLLQSAVLCIRRSRSAPPPVASACSPPCPPRYLPSFSTAASCYVSQSQRYSSHALLIILLLNVVSMNSLFLQADNLQHPDLPCTFLIMYDCRLHVDATPAFYFRCPQVHQRGSNQHSAVQYSDGLLQYQSAHHARSLRSWQKCCDCCRI
jgi:hypothetical protein